MNSAGTKAASDNQRRQMPIKFGAGDGIRTHDPLLWNAKKCFLQNRSMSREAAIYKGSTSFEA